MADADGYVRGETLDIFFEMMDEDTVNHIFDEEIENMMLEETPAQNAELICTSCHKLCKRKGGLTRHINSKHGATKKEATVLPLEKNTVKTLMSEAKTNITRNGYFPKEFCDSIEHYSMDISDDFLAIINKIYSRLTKKNDGDEFYSSFYSTIVVNASVYLSPLQRPASTLLAQKLADKIFHFYKQPKESTENIISPITEKEMGGLQYLAGYVVKKIKKKALSGQDYNSQCNQSRAKVLTHAVVEQIHDQKLIETLNRGGLTAVNFSFQKIFLKAEEQFRKVTGKNSHLSNINISEITDTLLENTEVVSYYNSVVDTSGVTSFEEEEREKLLIDMLSLYLRVRSFSLARDIVSKHKLSSKKKRAKALRNEIKKTSEKPHITE